MRVDLPLRWTRRLLLSAALLGTAQVSALSMLEPGNAPTPLPVPAAREAGHPFLRNYLPREYEGSHTTFSVVQDNDGVMYVGTRSFLLEFDGVTWSRIPVGDPIGTVNALTIQPGTGTVFVGGTSELGHLQTLPRGTHAFVSLLDRLPPEARRFRMTSAAYAAGDAVYFVAEQQVMRWQAGRFEVWPMPGKSVLRSAFIDGQLYVLREGIGLFRLEGDAFRLYSDDAVLTRAGGRFLLPNPDGSLLLGTFTEGLFILRDGAVTPVEGAANELLKAASIRTAQRLRDGTLVVGTQSSGIIVLDGALQFRARWDMASGLQDDVLRAAFEDREGGVWLALDVGVSRVEPSPVMSVFDERNGLRHGLIWDMKRAAGAAHLSTDKGLFRLRPADPANAIVARFEPLLAPGICQGICPMNEGQLAYGPGVTWLAADGRQVPVRTRALNTTGILRSRARPERLFTAVYNHGLNSVRWDAAAERWEEEGDIPQIGDSVSDLVEDAEGGLWVGTWNEGLVHLQFAEGADRKPRVASLTSYFQQPGALAGQTQVWVRPGAEREVLVAAKGGVICRYDPASARFVPAGYARLSTSDAEIDGFFSSADGEGLWLLGKSSDLSFPGQRVGWAPRFRPGREADFRPLPRKIADRIGRILDIFPDENGVVWVAGSEGAAMVHGREWLLTPSPAAPRTLLRRAFSTAGQGRDEKPVPVLGAALPHARNSVHFDFAAMTFEAGPRPSYQTRLLGLGASQWSNFHEHPSADYANLPEGDYTFEVRSCDVDGRVGGVATVIFRILPPWQRTLSAYALYIVASLAAVYALVRWRNRQLQRDKVILEGIVTARTGELRARETELVRARDAAEGANRAKSSFLANMSHELRTPLNAILGYSQILLGDTKLPARSREQIAVIGQSGGHLLSLINEVLDIAKIEAGRLDLDVTDFPLAPLLDEVGAAFRPRLAEKGLAFHDVRDSGLPPALRTDRNRLRQVLFNLLGNAVKFTRQGSVRLETGLGDEDGLRTLRFAVADTGIGIGIAAEERAKIFEAFHQGGDRRLAAQGTGLGLAISQQLARLLGGGLHVESSPGRGSRFWLDLPLASVVTSPGSIPSEDGSSSADLALVTGYRGIIRRVLVVDDVEENRRVLNDLLTPLGFVVREAADGATCLQECAREWPDAVLLDLRMGPPDGFDVARELRARAANDGGARPAVVALSASVFESDRQSALDAGCDEFLPKPFRTGQILAVLGRLLSLVWTHAEASPPTPSAGPVAAAGVLSAAELDGLRGLSERGDVMGIRKQLEAWQSNEAHPARAALARQLLPLTVAYQVDELHARLMALTPAP